MVDIPSNKIKDATSRKYSVIGEVLNLLGPTQMPDNYVCDYLEAIPEVKDDLDQLLEQHGIRAPVSIVAGGREAVTFVTSQNQLVRICMPMYDKCNLEELPPTVLKPLVSLDLNEHYPSEHLRVDVMPLVKVGENAHITPEEVEQLIKDTATYNYFFYDAQPINVGRLHDGTPIIIDLGAVKPELAHLERTEFIQGHYKMYLHGEIDERIKTLRACIGKNPSKDYAAAQTKHADALHLKYGEVSGVIPDSTINSVSKALRGGSNTITTAMREGRHDQKSWDALMDQAQQDAEKTGLDSGEVWRERIRLESKKRADAAKRDVDD